MADEKKKGETIQQVTQPEPTPSGKGGKARVSVEVELDLDDATVFDLRGDGIRTVTVVSN